MRNIFVVYVMLVLTGCNGQVSNSQTSTLKVIKTNAQWQRELSPEQFEILRNKGTERPFSGVYNDHFEKGTYVCAACSNLLFTSEGKFKTDCGWPSFDRAFKGSVIYQTDTSYGMKRTEVMCAACGGHLGHVFEDGPAETTGMRYCTNSASIKFIPKKN
jgi:peptide-methionine (R)-S-oxide reductase